MNISKTPLISIITVSYNAAATIEQTILSVINQDFVDYEYIIVDGGSTDGTVDIIKKYQEKFAYWVSEPDNGIYDAMNKGVKIAIGDLIALLNSDDWYEDGTLTTVANCFYLNPHVDVFHGLLRFIDENTHETNMIRGVSSVNLEQMMIEHPTCFIKREVYDMVGSFNLKYKSAADYDWMLSAKYKGSKFLLIPEVLTNFRLGGMSSSFTSLKEDLKIKKKFGIYKISKYMYKYVLLYLAFLRK